MQPLRGGCRGRWHAGWELFSGGHGYTPFQGYPVALRSHLEQLPQHLAGGRT
jgi:hypothetical protein